MNPVSFDSDRLLINYQKQMSCKNTGMGIYGATLVCMNYNYLLYSVHQTSVPTHPWFW